MAYKQTSTTDLYLQQWLLTATGGNVSYDVSYVREMWSSDPSDDLVQFRCNCGGFYNTYGQQLDTPAIPYDLQEWVKLHSHINDKPLVEPKPLKHAKPKLDSTGKYIPTGSEITDYVYMDALCKHDGLYSNYRSDGSVELVCNSCQKVIQKIKPTVNGTNGQAWNSLTTNGTIVSNSPMNLPYVWDIAGKKQEVKQETKQEVKSEPVIEPLKQHVGRKFRRIGENSTGT